MIVYRTIYTEPSVMMFVGLTNELVRSGLICLVTDTSRPKSPVNSFSLADELRQVDSSFGSREQHETADVGWRRLDTPSGTDYPRDCRDVVRGAAEFCRRDEFLDDEMTPDRRVTSEKWGVTPEKWGGHCGRSSPVSPPSSRYSDQSSGSVSAGSTPGTYQEAPGELRGTEGSGLNCYEFERGNHTVTVILECILVYTSS